MDSSVTMPPKHLHDELAEDYRDMIYADTAAEIEKRRKAFLRKWHLKCRAVADSLGKQAIGSSHSPALIRRNGSPPGPPTPSNA